MRTTEYHITELLKQLHKQPSSVVFSRVCEALRKSKQWDHALEICKQGLTRHPNYASGWFTLGMIHRDMEKCEEAKDAFQKTIALDPDHIPAYEKLTDLAIQKQNWSEAQKYVTAILMRYPLHPKAKTWMPKITQMVSKATATRHPPSLFSASDGANPFTRAQFRLRIIRNLRQKLSSLA